VEDEDETVRLTFSFSELGGGEAAAGGDTFRTSGSSGISKETAETERKKNNVYERYTSNIHLKFTKHLLIRPDVYKLSILTL